MSDKKVVPILEMKNITKRFPGVTALSDVNLSLYAGEVHILMGENGAGKSTLMKVLSGAHQCCEGEIYIHGQLQKKWNPTCSQKNGVAMVYQEFNLVPHRSVMENMFLGREFCANHLFLKKKEMHAKVRNLLETFELNIDSRTLISELGVAQQQMVEIAKALLFDVKILVLDEPTAALTVSETENLFKAITKLKQQGVGIFYISHRLEEIERIGDRVSVIRDGNYIGTGRVGEIEVEEIVKMMVGREVSMMYPRNFCKPSGVALNVKNLTTRKVRDVSFELKFGEILGMSGLVGAGRTEVARAIFGLDPVITGEIEVCGKQINNWNVTSAIAEGIGYVSEDRKDEGLFLNLSVQKNISIASLRKDYKSGIIDLSRECASSIHYIEKLKIKTPKPSQKVGNLSGGNQQKVVVGKWLATEPRILIFDEPTRGIDVGAKVEIHSLMDKLVNEGNAVIMISSDLSEVIGMSDRVIVMSGGTNKGEFPRGANPEEIINCAMGE